jgi:hypothetical protein
MLESRSAAILAALRVAAQPEPERYLVGLRDGRDHARLCAALAAEGDVVPERSTSLALPRLADEPFELAVLDFDLNDGVAGHFRPLLRAATESALPADLLLLIEADPARSSELFAANDVVLLPRPLPEDDAVLRAHVRWLASCRRSRTRARRLRDAITRC